MGFDQASTTREDCPKNLKLWVKNAMMLIQEGG